MTPNQEPVEREEKPMLVKMDEIWAREFGKPDELFLTMPHEHCLRLLQRLFLREHAKELSHQKALSRAEVLFNRQELEIMYIDYKSLIGVTKMMNRQVVGDKKLEFVLNANDQVREEILAKLENHLSDTLAVVDELEGKK